MQQTFLTEHFSLREMTKTSVKGVDNSPDDKALQNLKRLCQWLERLRQRWNTYYGEGDDGIIINSGYRSDAVNRAVGGSKTSNHLTGCAADIRCAGVEQALRYAVLILDYADTTKQDFDELLVEKSGNKYWVHLAVRPTGNRRNSKILTL